jgi:hypothetical protein
MSGTPSVPATLDAIASCFEGVVPATICSCAADGTPNVTYLSIVQRLDEWHVGLSYQFFNKTRKNVLENAMVQVIVVSPETADQYRLDLQYERTEVEGPAFDRMSTRLAAVASQTGMSEVFTLRGVDVYRVLDLRSVNAEMQAEAAPIRQYLADVEFLTGQLATCLDLDSLLDTALTSLATLFGYAHAFVMIPDEADQRLYTIASRGYDASGVGSEVWLGDGMLGVAAQRRMIVRTTSMTRDVVFSRAVRASIEQSGYASPGAGDSTPWAAASRKPGRRAAGRARRAARDPVHPERRNRPVPDGRRARDSDRRATSRGVDGHTEESANRGASRCGTAPSAPAVDGRDVNDQALSIRRQHLRGRCVSD